MQDVTAVSSTVTTIEHLGTLGAAILFVIAGYKRWVVWGYQLTDQQAVSERLQKERDTWQDLCLKNIDATHTAIEHCRQLALGANAKPPT